jgi:hypothetical protein
MVEYIMKTNYSIRKYDGDDCYSWAVFRKDDLGKGHRGIVFYGDARPIYSGCSRNQANYYKKLLQSKS